MRKPKTDSTVPSWKGNEDPRIGSGSQDQVRSHGSGSNEAIEVLTFGHIEG
jgi:hypothetical protein